MPIYRIKQTITEGGDKHVAERLIDAPNRARAINYVAEDTIEAEVCASGDLIRLTKDGVNVEAAKS